MTFAEAVQAGFRNYVQFSGRAMRSEYWYWALFVAVASVAAGILDRALGLHNALRSVLSLALLLPNLGVAVRRLHDIGRSGWWLLLVYGAGVLGVIILVASIGGAVATAALGGRPVAAGGLLLLGGGTAFALILGAVVYSLYLFTRPSDPGANQYGPMPGSPPMTAQGG